MPAVMPLYLGYSRYRYLGRAANLRNGMRKQLPMRCTNGRKRNFFTWYLRWRSRSPTRAVTGDGESTWNEQSGQLNGLVIHEEFQFAGIGNQRFKEHRILAFHQGAKLASI